MTVKAGGTLNARGYLLGGLCLGLLVGAAIPPTNAADDPAERDVTPVRGCDALPPSVSFPAMNWSETAAQCREMSRVLEGIRNKDITMFEKAAYVLRKAGYEGDYPRITTELVEIVRLRGLYDKPDRWFDTNEIVVKSWNAFNGAVGPRQIIAFLRSAGPQVAHSLSDDGLMHMIILMKMQYQRGE
ncbi:hypothetical protein ACVIGB_006507 [Bradyrhizobium sp. USDA 4341]